MSDTQTLSRAMLDLATTRGPDKTICPSEVARRVGGPQHHRWRPLMAPIKDIAVQLAKAGKIDIRQGGKTVDPGDVTGIYRIGIKNG